MPDFELRDLAIRDATEGDGRTIEGVVMVYGEPVRGSTREYGSAVETFAPGSFRDIVAKGERIPVVDEHYGSPVGYADKLWEDGNAVRFSGRLFSMQAAKDFAERVAGGVLRVSAEFLPGEIKRGAGTVTHTRVKALGAIAGSYFPAYAGTSVSVRSVGGPEVAEDQETLPEKPVVVAGEVTGVSKAEVAKIATAITEDAMRSIAARSLNGGDGIVDPFANWRGLTLGQMAQRAMNSDKREDALWPQIATRALDDLVTTSGANAGAITPGVFGEVAGIVNLGRPSITAFGGPRAIPDASGMTLDWPYFDGTLTDFVGAQSAEKAAITSGTLDIKKGSEALATYAGGADISYQLLRRAQSSYIEMWTQVMLAAWALVTNTAFVTELESGSVTSDFAEALSAVDATEFKNLLIDASVAVQVATGRPAEFALASTTAYKQFAKLYTPITTLFNTGTGTTNIRTLEVTVGNLPLIHEPALTAGKIIVSNRLAAAWFEDGPFQAQAEDVETLGRNVAIWSMGAGARFIPAGIIEMYDVTP
jgi:phage head maturation protease